MFFSIFSNIHRVRCTTVNYCFWVYVNFTYQSQSKVSVSQYFITVCLQALSESMLHRCLGLIKYFTCTNLLRLTWVISHENIWVIVISFQPKLFNPLMHSRKDLFSLPTGGVGLQSTNDLIINCTTPPSECHGFANVNPKYLG